jgi:hypothetical protein
MLILNEVKNLVLYVPSYASVDQCIPVKDEILRSAALRCAPLRMTWATLG